MAARAATTFLHLLTEEISGAFLTHSTNEVSRWFHWSNSAGMTFIIEVDCKDRFNNIKPSGVQSHLKEASEWLFKWSCRRMNGLVAKAWIGPDVQTPPNSDTSPIPNCPMLFILKWTVTILSGRWGTCGTATVASPWGVPFRPWICTAYGGFTSTATASALGFLQVSPKGFAWWDGPYGQVSLCEFRDNILIATEFPNDPSTPIVQDVIDILRRCFGLHVLCNCMSQPGNPCAHSCRNTACTTLSFGLVRREGGIGLVYLHPSTLSQSWSIKGGPPPLITRVTQST